MSNTSATGGYLAPTETQPEDLTFEEFLQQVYLGITGLPGDLIRPRWQIDPPLKPDNTVDWCSFGVSEEDADANAALVQVGDVQVELTNETIQLLTSFYGPHALQFARTLRNGFQIAQNREVLFLNNMGYKDCTPIVRAPELVNDTWYDRYDLTITLVRQIQPSYQILSFLAVGGTITANGVPPSIVPWNSQAKVPDAFNSGYDESAFA